MPLAERLKALGDESRLRILRLLRREELNVSELTLVLGMPQSTVSKHLGELRKAGLVAVDRNGGYSYYHLAEDLGEWWNSLVPLMEQEGVGEGDDARLRELLRQRAEKAEVDRFLVPGRSWVAWSRALGYLLPALRVADFGCGDGTFTVEMARWARQVFAVDSNQALLERARQQAQGLTNVVFLLQEMERVSLRDASVEVVLISQSLHYLAEPLRAIAEARRILAPAGRLLILDLLPHGETWVREQLHHRWLGFDPVQIRRWMEEAGLQNIQWEVPPRRSQEPFQAFLVTGVRGTG